MTFMNSLVFFLTCIFSIITITQYRNIKKSIKFISKESKKPLSGKINNTLIIMIPAMDEHAIIESTVIYFQEILKIYPHSKLVFITTEKEGAPAANRTYQKILHHASRSTLLMHYPLTTGNKADQINYAVAQLTETLGSNVTPTYYGIFDADSRPDRRGLDYISRDEHQEQIYQMLPVYSTNFSKLSTFGKASAIFQTRWMMSHELPTLINNYRMQKPIHLAYCIGHGLFIRKSYLERHPFPTRTVTEDLLFGYQAVINKVYAKPVPYFDYCSSASRFYVGIRQSARWHSGDLSSLIMLIGNNIKSRNNRFIFLQVKRALHMLQWPFGPVLISLALFESLHTHYLAGAFSIMVLIGCYVFLLHAPIIKFFFGKSDSPIHIYGALLLKSTNNCFGALYSYYLRLIPNSKLWFKTPKE